MSDYQRDLKASNRQRNLPAARITVGARRSIRYTPPSSIDRLADGSPSDPRQLELMARIDHAVYHAPLDSRPARPRKAGPVLGAALKAGERAMADDDLGTPKRPCAVAIVYRTATDETVCSIWGGLTAAQGDAMIAAARRSGMGHGYGISAAQAETMIASGRDASDRRVVLWPSELQRRGAAPIRAAESPRESYGYSRTETGRHAEAIAA